MKLPADLFDQLSPERRALLERLLAERAQAKRAAHAPQEIRRRETDGPVPLSFAQQRLWFIDQLQPGSSTYNMPSGLRLRGPLDVRALRRALTELTRRHESLRTVFAVQDGEPVQVVLPPGPAPLPVVDLGRLPPEESGRELRRLQEREADLPFDLARGPLLRSTLVRIGERESAALFTMHHIVSDGWSMGVLTREVSELYAAYAAGLASPLPELPIQYADYTLWQREHLSGERLEAQLAYWKERLSGAPPLLELPTDRPRPTVEDPSGTGVRFLVPLETAAGLRALIRSEGTTPYMTLLAGWQLLLSRWSGQDDVLVGSPIANRTRKELEPLIGFFVNTLVIRTDLSGDPTVRELLRQVRERVLEAQSHQDLPFERLVEAVQPERSLSHSPIFQVMLALQNTDRGHLALGESRIEPLPNDQNVTKFDLLLTLNEGPDTYGGGLAYRTSLWDAPTIERLVGHYLAVLAGMAADPDQRISALTLLGPEEEEQVLRGWNRTGAGYPAGAGLRGMFEAQAARTPDAVAMVDGERRLTYAELDRAGNRLAHHLRALGVGTESRVGICLERSMALPLGVLGIVKAGGAYVPLDPDYPAERLAYMLEDAGIGVLLTQESIVPRLPRTGAALVRMDADAERIAAAPDAPPPVETGPENLGYVIYTSGSTGRPKGVAMTLRPLVNLMAWQLRSWDGPARTTQFSSISFDVSFHEIFGTWCSGGTLVVVPADTRVDLLRLARLLDEERIERLHLPFVALHHLAEVAEGRPGTGASLREVLTAGEQLRVTGPIRRWLGGLEGVTLSNQYGPSETHVVTALTLRGDPRAWPALPSIGGPIANTQAYVLDRALHPAPVGVPGELYLGGDNLARGYLGRPDLTAERFVPDPFGPAPGGRLYRSGDRVRWLPGGEIEFLGRTDQQVKIRGIRIEPGEVEATLERHPRVREAVVYARGEAPGERRLVGYVVPADGAAPTPAELQGFLAGELPEHMVPAAFVVLDAFPLTPTGKIDRRALPAPESGAAEGAGYAAPRTPVEERLAGIWAEVLKAERVGVHDGFFALGGHSLLATRVISRVREAFGVELPLRALFQAPTVAGMAERIEARRREEGAAPSPAGRIPRRATDGPVPLSFAQQRLWLIDRMEPGSPAYHLPTALRLRGALDPTLLERALGEIVRRHESLRTVFAVHDGEPVQVVRPAAPAVLPAVDLRALPEAERAREAGRLARDEARRPFDLERGPLLRSTLLRLDERESAILFTMHHVVSDGWSMGVLVREVSALYAAFAAGRGSPLPELPVQYPDYALWQRERLTGEVLGAQLGYWRERLAGAPPVLELPTDRPRPPVVGIRGDARGIVLSPEVSRALRGVGAREGATLFMTLLAGWQLLLSRYAGEEDVSVGTPVAGRERLELEGLIGFFVNTLVVRTDLSGDPTFRELLARVRETTLGAQSHQEIPFERLVEELAPERSLQHTPLFQVMFALQNNERGELRLGDLQVEPLGAGGGSGAAKFDLELSLQDDEERIWGTLSFRTDLWEPETVERLLEHFRRVLEGVAADPERRVSEVELLSGAERERVLAEWNAGAAYPADHTLHGRFAEVARRDPTAVAVTYEGRELTYGELESRANRLARHLRGRGVGPETPVGLHAARGIELVVGILGILKAGGAYVPLDPSYPAERLAYVVADAGIRVLLTHSAVGDTLPAGAAETVSLDGEWERIAAEGDAPFESGAGPESLAYVIYTSGSTGRPKGVMVEHRQVARLFSATDEWFGFAPGDVWTLFHSYAFDFSVWEIWGALLHGGRLVVVPWETSRSPEELHRLLVRERVTVLNQTPSAFRQLVAADAAAGDADALALREVVFGGEALEFHTLGPWFERHGDRRPRLVNMYGITETTVHVTFRPLTAADAEAGKRSLIGRGIPDLRLYVVGAGMHPVPVGVPGELLVGGAGVARGYLGRPELTAERFVPDPFGGEPGARLYRSGDRVRWLPDGELEYLGRADQQVKVRGFRIEPGEVEAALLELEGVREAVVVVREDASGERSLVAYVVPAAGREAPTPAGLRAALQERLPAHMVPSAFVALEAIPLTPNGKLDRRALPAPEGAGSEGGYVAPRTPTEEALAGIWAEVLKTERVGVHDDFFALGGHSLLATRVTSRVREALGVEVPLRVLFELPTVAGMAQWVDAALPSLERPAPDAPGDAAGMAELTPERRLLLHRLLRARTATREIPPLRRVPRDRPLPLSFAQQRLWFIDRMEPGSAAYNMPFPLRLRGPLDFHALQWALGETVRRHESLRTVFEESDGEPVQTIRPAGAFRLPVVDLGALPEAARRAEALRLARSDAARPFDLRRGPLLRALLVRLGEAEHAALFNLHHIISDGWSTGILVRELSALYTARVQGRPSPLPEPPVQYADYAAWQREWLSGEALQEQLAFWREQLEGAPPALDLPTDHPRPAVPSSRGGRGRFLLSPESTAALRELGRAEGATPFMLLLAGLQLLLARYVGVEDVSVGTAIAGRNRLELEGLIGFFVNDLVIRADLSGRPSGRALLQQVRERTLGAFAHQELPFEKLVEELAPERSLQQTPLFQVMFNMQNLESEALRLGEVAVEPLGTAGEGTKFDLSFYLSERGDHFGGFVSYRTDLWEEETIGRMLEQYAALLGALAAEPDRPVAELPWLSPAERREVLERGTGPVREVPGDGFAQSRFEAQVRRTPEAVAVVFEDRTLTYAELDRAANRLARYLQRHGVRPETRVGVCLERSPEMVVAILAVFKAGGVYVPLDPTHPAERLAYMLADSGAPLVLVQERTADRITDGAARRIVLERAGAEIDREEDTAPKSCATQRNLAYVIYTSGSTGRPKGVLTPHRGVVNYLGFLADEYALGPGDTVLQLATVSFDASVRDILGPLSSGARLLLVRAEETADPVRLLEHVRTHGVTAVLAIVPTLLRPLLDAAGAQDARDTALRLLLLSGEPLPVADVRRAHASFGAQLRVVNQWGATECTMSSTLHSVTGAEEGVIAPVGRPIHNTRVYVLDPELNPVPDGVPGEAYIATPGVTRGYQGEPGLSAEKFVPDPYSGEPGGRMYRVGDRVRRLREGALEFLGRMDAQVKVGGVRVEPGEVEAALRAHPAVRTAAVVAREDAPGQTRLVAYVVAEPGREVAAGTLRGWLAERLPPYMVPSAWVWLEGLPTLPNGKLDRRALPEGAGEGEGYVAPRTPTEEILAGIWAEVLGVERVGVEDDFFGLGGHSLLATRMIARVRGAFGVELALRALFEVPTVGGIAARVEGALRAGEGSEVPPIERVPREGPLPLSFAQQRLWFIDRLEPGSTAYSVPYPLRLRGALDVRALRRALTEVVRRHESLRTVFAGADGEPVQVVRPAAPVVLPVVDLRGLPGAEREAEALRLVRDEVARPFDLARGPLFRALLVHLGGGEWGLVLNLHHIVSDGWSTGILTRELSTLYAAYARGAGSPLPELPVQYPDYAVWQRRWLSGARLEEEVAYWRAQLAGAPPVLELPTDRPRAPVPGAAGASVPFVLPPEAAAGARALARREGATLFMVLLAAWQALLARWSGQDDVVVGTPIAGRTRTELEGLIGFFVNTLVLRTELSGGPTGRELLRRVREATLGAFAHQHVPFEKLVEELQPERSLQHTPLFQVMFILQNNERVEAGAGALAMEPMFRGPESAKFDLTLSMMEEGERVAGALSYRAELWEEATLERMAGHFVRLLAGVTADPERPAAEVPLLLPTERERIAEWNAATRRDYPAGLVHELFAAQARQTPNATAVVHRGAALSYAETARHTALLANHLRGRGVGPETRVGVCLRRTPELPVALLAVLAAGGAYVPLDPEYPAERLRHMLEDAGAMLVVTTSALADRLPAGAAEVLLLDEEGERIAVESDALPEAGVGPENLSHLIFTSGSTGRPKGVMIRHRGVSVLLHWLRENVPDEERASVLCSTSVGFDVSVAEIFGTLCWGGKLVLVENALELPSVAEQGIRLATMVPTAAAELLRMGGIPRSVRAFNLGGEALPADLARALYALDHVEVVRNLYGPTEDTTYSTCSAVERGAERVRIGRPISNTRAYVLDRALQPAPVGVIGELYLAGAGLSRGYASRPDLTAERFLPDPFGEPGERMYRVMDRARWTPAGELEYFGRTDFQVKVRGFRIELEEIEAVLRAHPAVREAVAVVREDAPGERRLAAYVVAAEGEDPTGGLRAHLRAHLPEYMVPAAFVRLDALPLTSSGKVDRRALPAPERTGAEREYVAPRGAVEELLAGIFSEVLGVERVGAHDDFFELGGHSLLATRVVARIRDVFGVETPLRTLFETPTVARLAEHLAVDEAGAEEEDWESDEDLERLAGLSDEEVMRLLRGEG